MTFGVIIFNFEHISHIALVFSLLTLNKLMSAELLMLLEDVFS